MREELKNILNTKKDVNYVNEFLNGNYTFHNIDIELMIPQKYKKEEVMKLREIETQIKVSNATTFIEI